MVRIEDDIITLSELRELAAYQQLLDGHSQSNEELRSELIEQWVVNNEATTTRFPLPAEAEVDREVSRVESSFPGLAAYQQRLEAVGLTRKPCAASSRGKSIWRVISITNSAPRFK